MSKNTDTRTLRKSLDALKALLRSVPDEYEPAVLDEIYASIGSAGEEVYNVWEHTPVDFVTGLRYDFEGIALLIKEIAALGAKLDWKELQSFESTMAGALFTFIEFLEKAIAAGAGKASNEKDYCTMPDGERVYISRPRGAGDVGRQESDNAGNSEGKSPIGNWGEVEMLAHKGRSLALAIDSPDVIEGLCPNDLSGCVSALGDVFRQIDEIVQSRAG